MTRGKFTVGARGSVLTAVLAIVAAAWSCSVAGSVEIRVSNSAELQAALVPANEGKSIVLAKAEYIVSATLIVPKGASLIGGGKMLYDHRRLPVGIEDRLPRLRSATTLSGDILILSDGARVSGLVIEEGRSAGATNGNLVVVQSNLERTPVSAEIDEIDLVVPYTSGVGPDGPTRRGLLVWTRNLNLGLPPEPESVSQVAARMTNSIIRSLNGGSGIFVNNFAPRASVSMALSNNVIGGLSADGGTSRGDLVEGSSTTILSQGNVYRDETTLATVGMAIQGCSIPPVPALASLPSVANTARLHSVHDSIEGFSVGILAAGGRRTLATGAAPSGCSLDLVLQDTYVRVRDRGLLMFGAGAYPPPLGVSPGDHNELRVLIRGVKVDAPNPNVFADQASGPAYDGLGNRLEVIGNLRAYESTNDAGNAPPPEFFGNH